MTMTAAHSRPLTPFVNEPVAPFTTPESRAAAAAKLAEVRKHFGKEHQLWIAGAHHKTGDLLESVNPSNPSEIVGRHHKATTALASKAIEDAHAYFFNYPKTT